MGIGWVSVDHIFVSRSNRLRLFGPGPPLRATPPHAFWCRFFVRQYSDVSRDRGAKKTLIAAISSWRPVIARCAPSTTYSNEFVRNDGVHRCAAVTPDNQTMHNKHQLKQQIRLHRWDGLLRRGGARQPRDAHQAQIIAANSFATLGYVASPRRRPITTRCTPNTIYSSSFVRSVGMHCFAAAAPDNHAMYTEQQL